MVQKELTLHVGVGEEIGREIYRIEGDEKVVRVIGGNKGERDAESRSKCSREAKVFKSFNFYFDTHL